MIVRETIYHGNYRNVRDVECPLDGVETLTLLGATSPYRFTFSAENRWHVAAAEKFNRGESFDIGWADYEIIDPGASA